MSRNKKTDEKSRGRHAMPEENNKKNNDKQVKQKQPNMRIKKQEPVKANKKVKTVRKVKRVVVTILLLAIILAGTLFGYKIYQNGGGLTGALATILGEDTEKLQNLEPIQLLIMGESGVDDYKLADTIMVASYNPKTQKASLMSIPRDTYVGRRNRNTATQNYLASYKINTVFRSGTNIPEAIENTVKIAEKCNFDFEFGNTKLPNYEVPKEYATHADFFKELCRTGLKNRYGDNPSKVAQDRLEYEISVIEKMGYVDYYLIVWDFINYAKTQGISVGPGRGSGAGSIAAFAMGITDIDPIKYNLLFERFLNPERISMPDFDIDFCYERRPEVIEYVARKYGRDHVSQIITFGTMAAKMVIRDVARVLDIPYAEADKLAKMIPNEVHITIKKALEQNRELQELYENDEETKKILDIAMRLEGLPRQASTHACRSTNYR